MLTRTLTIHLLTDFRHPNTHHTPYISPLPVADDAAFDLLVGNQVTV